MARMKILFDPRHGYDRCRITGLEPSHLKKLVALLVRLGEDFDCEQMSGGKWVLRTSRGSLLPSEIARITGSVEEE